MAGRTAREIAGSVEAAVREGRLESGVRLPTVRDLAQRLGVSPATVNAAYRTLGQRGVVVGEGRRGTRVAPRPPVRAPEPPRHRPFKPSLRPGVRSLAVGEPDAALLPALAPALARLDTERLTQIGDFPVNDSRLMAIARDWFAGDGIATDSLAVVSGTFDGLERVLRAHLRPGDAVLIEDPAYPSIRDLLLALGLLAIPVLVDERGMRPDALAEGLARGAEAMVVVPRAQNPFGSALDGERAAELAELLGEHPELLLVEDDHASLVCGAPYVSAIPASRTRWAVVRSVSKFLRADLRLAVMAGDPVTISRVEGQQAVGPRWVSHLLQSVVAELMSDPGFPELVTRAADAYRRRREEMLSALAQEGLEGHGRTGLNVWVPVREEARATQALLEAGYQVMPGERFRVHSPPAVRITIATLRPSEAVEIASTLAEAERAAARVGGY